MFASYPDLVSKVLLLFISTGILSAGPNIASADDDPTYPTTRRLSVQKANQFGTKQSSPRDEGIRRLASDMLGFVRVRLQDDGSIVLSGRDLDPRECFGSHEEPGAQILCWLENYGDALGWGHHVRLAGPAPAKRGSGLLIVRQVSKHDPRVGILGGGASFQIEEGQLLQVRGQFFAPLDQPHPLEAGSYDRFLLPTGAPIYRFHGGGTYVFDARTSEQVSFDPAPLALVRGCDYRYYSGVCREGDPAITTDENVEFVQGGEPFEPCTLYLRDLSKGRPFEVQVFGTEVAYATYGSGGGCDGVFTDAAAANLSTSEGYATNTYRYLRRITDYVENKSHRSTYPPPTDFVIPYGVKILDDLDPLLAHGSSYVAGKWDFAPSGDSYVLLAETYTSRTPAHEVGHVTTFEYFFDPGSPGFAVAPGNASYAEMVAELFLRLYTAWFKEQIGMQLGHFLPIFEGVFGGEVYPATNSSGVVDSERVYPGDDCNELAFCKSVQLLVDALRLNLCAYSYGDCAPGVELFQYAGPVKGSPRDYADRAFYHAMAVTFGAAVTIQMFVDAMLDFYEALEITGDISASDWNRVRSAFGGYGFDDRGRCLTHFLPESKIKAECSGKVASFLEAEIGSLVGSGGGVTKVAAYDEASRHEYVEFDIGAASSSKWVIATNGLTPGDYILRLIARSNDQAFINIDIGPLSDSRVLENTMGEWVWKSGSQTFTFGGSESPPIEIYSDEGQAFDLDVVYFEPVP